MAAEASGDRYLLLRIPKSALCAAKSGKLHPNGVGVRVVRSRVGREQIEDRSGLSRLMTVILVELAKASVASFTMRPDSCKLLRQ